MIITYYLTQPTGRMPKPEGKGHANRWFSAQPARNSLNPEEKFTLSLYFGGI
jgi:hypothetical protein